MPRNIIGIGLVAASLFAFAVAAQAEAKTAAVGQFYSNGQPTSGVLPVPNCRTCTVKQLGPNHYEIKIPNDVRAKLGMPRK